MSTNLVTSTEVTVDGTRPDNERNPVWDTESETGPSTASGSTRDDVTPCRDTAEYPDTTAVSTPPDGSDGWTCEGDTPTTVETTVSDDGRTTGDVDGLKDTTTSSTLCDSRNGRTVKGYGPALHAHTLHPHATRRSDTPAVTTHPDEDTRRGVPVMSTSVTVGSHAGRGPVAGPDVDVRDTVSVGPHVQSPSPRPSSSHLGLPLRPDTSMSSGAFTGGTPLRGY